MMSQVRHARSASKALLALSLACALVTGLGGTASAVTDVRAQALPAPGTISGTVYRADGPDPVQGLRVVAVGIGNDYVYEAETGVDGSYTMTGLADDEYIVTFDTGGYNEDFDTDYLWEAYNDTDWDNATLLHVGPTVGAANIDATLDVGARVEVQVFGPDGITRLPGVEVFVGEPGWGQNAWTEADGTAVMRGLIPGTDFMVWADPAEYNLEHATELYLEAWNDKHPMTEQFSWMRWADYDPVDLTGGETEYFTFTLDDVVIPPLVGTFEIDSGADYNTTRNMTFTSNVPDATTMRIRASADGGDTWGSWGPWDDYTTSLVMGVGVDGMWTYQIEYKNASQGVILQSSIIVDATAPDAPTGLTAVPASANAVNLSWDEVVDATSGTGAYLIFRDGVKVGETGGLSYQVTGLAPSTSYSFTVKAKDDAGNEGAASAAANATTKAAPVLTPVYRFFRPSTGTHFYTSSESEMRTVRDTMAATYVYEGIGYHMNAANPVNTVPLYRFRNIRTGTHLYTASESEMISVRDNLSSIYQLDGPAYFVSMSSGLEVHRFYDPRKGVHFYSSNPDEIANVRAKLAHIWQYEGPAYKVGQ